ncbi:7TM-DISM domain-containing protein [Polynucleobacter sp. 80A-SIGWE]|uniref:sensor histidine kinase n=1 Tax=Polynucleobacter sp. 80A-SIGWE TaxID=2689100 RepID=UPI001C0B51EB|nr:7TM-DISM domain-containing protein [Polynucleobacter sp. 80A-SIGWE]MBU3589540.1 hypothetical protein [Polynucleobacter sp. 80A-SIGWE]
MKTLVKSLFLVVALFIGCASASEGYLLGQAYFEDKTNSLTFEEVKKEKFTSYAGWLAKGYQPSTYWIRLDIRPSDKDLVLRIRPVFIEDIQLFDSSALEVNRVTGAKHEVSDSEIQTLNHNFNLGSNEHERQIYLKVKSVRTYLLGFEVMPASEFFSAEYTSSLIYAAYIIFIFLLALWLFGVWLGNRELVLGMFVIQQFVSFLHAFFLYGYARLLLGRFIDQSVINYMTFVLVVTYSFTAVVATKFLFSEYSLKRFYKYLFNGVICISVLIIAMLVVGNTGTALKINASFIILMGVLFWVTSFFGTSASGTQKNIYLPINILRLYYTFNLAMWAIVILPLLGFTQSNDLAIHYNLIYGVLSGLFFCLILQYRAKSILKNELVKSAALKKEVENERLRREEQGKLMSMLTHEIKTPLSVLKLVIDQQVVGSDFEEYANRAVTNIDSIINKCIQLDRLDLNVIQIHKTKFNFSDLLITTISDTRLETRFSILQQGDIDIESDFQVLSIVVSNLLGNAIKYSAPETEIVIDTEILESNLPRRLQFSVQNVIGNMGVPDPELAFEKYYRGPSATMVSGSGLGLFLVRELTHVLGGEVKLSIKDNLITFTVWIPI